MNERSHRSKSIPENCWDLYGNRVLIPSCAAIWCDPRSRGDGGAIGKSKR